MHYELWKELVEMEAGTILRKGTHDGIDFCIMRGPVSLTAYLRIPDDHPLKYIEDYNDIHIDVHGGVTFKSSNDWLPDGEWVGWDYAHYGDRCFYDTRPGEMEWTDDIVWSEVKDAIPNFKRYLDNYAQYIAGSIKS